MTWNQILHTDGRGRAWDFLNPDPAAIDWPTIALVLARTPRFNGHTTGGVYSVAQHLVEGARAILRADYTQDVAAAYLLHDAHEFVIGDDVRPKVEALAQLAYWAGANHVGITDDGRIAARALKAAFRDIKARADAVIYPAAGLAWPLSPEAEAVVRQFDNRMLRTEADARTGPRVAPWGSVVEDACPVEGADCSPWSAELAASLWLSLAKELLPALGSVPAPVSECECCEPSPPWWQNPDLLEGFKRYEEMDLRGWPDSPAPEEPSVEDKVDAMTEEELLRGLQRPFVALVKPTTVFSGERQDEQRYGNKRFKPQPAPDTITSLRDQSPAFDAACRPFDGELDTDALKARSDGAAIDAWATKLAGDLVAAGESETERPPVQDWCDWADGSRTPGTCTACGGFFGMLHAPSTCHRGGP